MQLGDEFDGAKGTKLHKNKENIEHKAACLSQLTNGVDNTTGIEKIYSPIRVNP